MLFTFKRQTQYKVECSLSLSHFYFSITHMHAYAIARSGVLMHAPRHKYMQAQTLQQVHTRP